MSDYTNGGYTKTGKKVMCINSNRRDLTYKKVYDVFTTQDSEWDFIIDDVGDKRYESLEFPYWCEKSDGVVDEANETKHKFKTGKKVKSIYDGRVDLTYNKVYDVFIDSDEDEYEFIIDDVGDKRYWSIYDDDYYELVSDVANAVDTANNINDNTKTKHKFKVGDKVKVVDTEQISTYTNSVRVNDVGVITTTKSLKTLDSYLVTLTFDGNAEQESWWFTDKCIELVYDDTGTVENNPTESAPIVSDGGSSSYYVQQIPKGMLERFNATGTIETKDVIRLFLGNDSTMGNIFKAYCRVISLRNGKGKAGIDEQYDLTKAKFFAEDELNYYLENKDV